LCLLLAAVFGIPLQSAVRAEEPRAIIERAIKAQGGEELLALKAATVAKIRGVFLDCMRKCAFSGELLHQSISKRRYKLNVELDGMKVSIEQVIDEGKGWRRLSDGMVLDTPEGELSETNYLLYQDRVASLLPLIKENGYTLTMLEETLVEGRPAFGIRAAYKDRVDSFLYFDKATGLLAKTSFKGRQRGELLETVLCDYREPGREDDERLLRTAGLDVNMKDVLAFLRRQTPDPAMVAQVGALIVKLGDESFDIREQAVRDLVSLEKLAIHLLQQARKSGDAEVSRRAGECLDQIEKRTSDATVLAAVRLVGWTRPPGGAETLLALLSGVGEGIASEIRAALVVYAEKNDPALVAALDDKDALRRSAARAVLGRDGGEYLKQPGRLLFVRGLKQPMRNKYYEDGKLSFEMEVVDYRVVNKIDPKVFEKPAQ
jgi:hypothetical protein